MKNVAIICSTYRAPEKNNDVRDYGIMKLVEQSFAQDYEGGNVTLVIVDDSPEPHPFLEELAHKLGEKKFMYFHLPSRNNLPQEIKLRFPQACSFVPDNGALDTPEWQAKLAKISAWENFLPFDYEFAKTYNLNMVGQVRADRPTIGMKKNFACMAYIEANGVEPEAFIFADDDDLRSPDYVSTIMEQIGEAGFARMTKTYSHNYTDKQGGNTWGEIDFKPDNDINGNWFIPAEVMDSECFKISDDGTVVKRPVHDLYPRNLQLAWPILSHDGALHVYKGETWKAAAEKFGGFFPTSFSEDIITHRMMHNMGVQTKRIDVDKPKFIRVADGRNASDFYATRILKEDEIAPWAKQSIEGFYDFISLGEPFQRESVIRAMARSYEPGNALSFDRSSDFGSAPNKPETAPSANIQ